MYTVTDFFTSDLLRSVPRVNVHRHVGLAVQKRCIYIANILLPLIVSRVVCWQQFLQTVQVDEIPSVLSDKDRTSYLPLVSQFVSVLFLFTLLHQDHRITFKSSFPPHPNECIKLSSFCILMMSLMNYHLTVQNKSVYDSDLHAVCLEHLEHSYFARA